MLQRFAEYVLTLRRAHRWIGALVVASGIAFVAMAATPRSSCACTTKRKAYVSAMKADLRNLVTAQEQFFADSQRYATALEELTPERFRLSTNIELVSLTSREGAWEARVSYPSGLEQTCSIAMGPLADGSDNQFEGEPQCDPPPREMYPIITGATYAVLFLIALGIRLARAGRSLPPLSGGTVMRFFAAAVVHPYWPHDRWDMSCDTNAVAMETFWVALMAAVTVWMAFRSVSDWEPPRPA